MLVNREKKKSTFRTHKFAIMAIFATLVVILITYCFDLLTLYQKPGFKVS